MVPPLHHISCTIDSSTPCDELLNPFLSTVFKRTEVLAIVIAVMTFVYGIHTVLYTECIQVLLARKRPRYRVHIFMISTLFLLATGGVVLYITVSVLLIRSVVFDRVDDEAELLVINWIQFCANALTIIGNIVTDIILIWRCHTLWQGARIRRIRIMIPIAVLSLTNNIQGIAALVVNYFNVKDKALDGGLKGLSAIVSTFTLVSAVVNVILTGMIAGRIFYISRQVIKYFVFEGTDGMTRKMYRTVVSASLESGLIYPIVLTTYTVSSAIMYFKALNDRDLNAIETKHVAEAMVTHAAWCSLLPVMGIASTLIIVRTAMGIAINDERSFRNNFYEQGGSLALPSDSGSSTRTGL